VREILSATFKVLNNLCTRLTLISTDKGDKLLQPVKRCASPFCVCAVDFTGHVYRGFHGMAFPISAAARVMARRVAA
jgi:hypothetical protein